ncbi:MAG: glycosyltransferase [Candidatus Omnitrophota bacterium]
MRIAFVVRTFPALSETFLLNQITGLMDAGCDVKILAGERSGDVVFHEEVVRHGLLHHVRFLNNFPSNWVGCFLKFLMMVPFKLLEAPGAVARSLNVVIYGSEAWSFSLFFKAAVFFDVRDCDIILCHSGESGLLALRMKRLGAVKGKVVTVFHMAELMALARSPMAEKLAGFFREGDLFLPVNEAVKRRLIELGCPESKIVVHRMGVDLAHFDVSARRRFAAGHLKIISVARLIEEKGLVYALEAMALLRGISYEYVIIGDGPLRAALESEAVRLGIARQVRFMGWQDSGTIRRYLKDTDIFLAPGISIGGNEYEGIPVVLIEAMASGVAVVTTSHGSVRDLVADGRTGFLVPEKDPAALAATFCHLREIPGCVADTAQSARQLIEEEYDGKALNQKLFRLLTNTVYAPV